QANRSASAAASVSSNAAVHAAPATPTRPTSAVSAAMTPTKAPSVFQPYNRPTIAPNCVRDRTSAPASTGSVAPIAVAGTIITMNAVASLRAFTAVSPRPADRRAIMAASGGSPWVRARPVTATINSSAAYTRSRSCRPRKQRPATALPIASPPMKLESTIVAAHTVLPKTRLLRWNQTISKMSPAAPETKKTNVTSQTRAPGCARSSRPRTWRKCIASSRLARERKGRKGRKDHFQKEVLCGLSGLCGPPHQGRFAALRAALARDSARQLSHDRIVRVLRPVLPGSDVDVRGQADRSRRPVHQARAHADHAVGDHLLIGLDSGLREQCANLVRRLEGEVALIGEEILPEDERRIWQMPPVPLASGPHVEQPDGR